MEVAKSWLHDCSKSHEECRPSSPPRLPYRILDLKPPSEHPTSDLRLSVNIKSHEPYATLSHCWGNYQPLRLLQSSYDDYQKRIAYNSLPKTFQDAVTATRALGLRYLWIDSLCIIQDSKTDWEEQCTMMGHIYSASFVTIAAPAAPDCDAGFLHPRAIPDEITIEVTDDERSDSLVLWYPGIGEFPMDFAPEPNAPLYGRAWALQERLVSPRVLFFGTRGMYLECFTHVRFETCHYPINWTYLNINMFAKSRIGKLERHAEIFEYWTNLVTAYSALSLTKIIDRLPAMSALAREFQAASSSEYLAGIWREDLHRGLTWYVEPWSEVEAVLPYYSSNDYLAPSWSWAACRFGVQYAMNSYQHQFQHDFDIMGATMVPDGLDPFGVLKYGHIDGSGKMRTCIVQERPDVVIPGRRSLYALSSGPTSSVLALFAPDDPITIRSQEFTVLLLYLGKFSSGISVAISLAGVEGLASTFKRTGFVFTDFPGWNSELESEDFPNFFKGIEKCPIRLI